MSPPAAASGAPPPTGRRRRRLSAALAVVVTVAFTYLAVRDVDFDELGQSLRESNYWWLVPALGMLALGFLLRAVRWRALFAATTRPDLWPTTQALLVGQFFNSVLPLRAGEPARVVALHALGGASRAETAGTVVVERFFDVLALLLLLFVALPWLPEVTWLRAAGLLAIALVLALAAAVLLLRVYGDRPLSFVLRPLARLPFLVPERVEAATRNLMHGLVALRSPRVGLVAFLWTVLSWLVIATSFWLVMLGFHLDLSPTAGLLTLIATGLALVLPSAPAAVGVFEAATLVALAAYGIPQTRALSYALVVHALNVLPFIAAGLVLLNVHQGLVGPARGRKRDRAVVARPRRLDRRRLRPRVGRDAGRTRDDEDDVAQPADGQLRIDELREPR